MAKRQPTIWLTHAEINAAAAESPEAALVCSITPSEPRTRDYERLRAYCLSQRHLGPGELVKIQKGAKI